MSFVRKGLASFARRYCLVPPSQFKYVDERVKHVLKSANFPVDVEKFYDKNVDLMALIRQTEDDLLELQIDKENIPHLISLITKKKGFF